MDAKVTLSFDETVINKAKRFAKENNISLSRLTEFLLDKVTSSKTYSLEELPISDWVNIVSEGEVEYQTQYKKNKDLKKEYFNRRKK